MLTFRPFSWPQYVEMGEAYSRNQNVMCETACNKKLLDKLHE